MSKTGFLSFLNAPDFEKPADTYANNTYIVVLRASNGKNITDMPVRISITDVNDNTPAITFRSAVSVPENTVNVTRVNASDADAGTTLNFSVSSGGDRTRFVNK